MTYQYLNNKNKSFYFLFLVLSIYFLDFITGNKLSDIFILNTLDISNYDKLWSLLTYPFKLTSTASLILFVFVMVIISKNLENIYKSNLIPVVYIIIILSHSVVFSLVNVDTDNFLSGTDGISFFILVLHLLINKNYTFSIYSFDFAISKFALSVMIFMWIFSQSLNYYAYGQNEVLNSFFLAGLGTCNALIVYLQLYVIKKLSSKRQIQEDEEYSEFNELEHTLATISESNKRITQFKTAPEEINLLSNNPYLDEERMNIILEKINESGFSSLSELEQKFLEEYSKKI